MRTLMLRGRLVSAAASPEILRLEELEITDPVVWCEICARDVTNKPTTIEIFAKMGKATHVLNCKGPAAANETVNLVSPVTLPGNYQLGCKVVGSTSDDIIEMYAYGYTLD
jgi:hypothetical protein